MKCGGRGANRFGLSCADNRVLGGPVPHAFLPSREAIASRYGRKVEAADMEETMTESFEESPPNPRSGKPQFAQAGFLTYSRAKRAFPSRAVRGSGMGMPFGAFWKLQQRDCPGLSPGSLFILDAGRQAGHL